jgi:12,18-didecarboxysiroheme deacetylase
MIGISKLYCGTVEPSDPLRYGRDISRLPSHLLQFASEKRPVVVWNITKICNLRCIHCYSFSDERPDPDELSTEEGIALIDDLARFGSPVLLISGGEPLTRKDTIYFIAHAVEKGMRVVLSTNGTLITKGVARSLKEAGLSYAGISIDGIRETNDRFRSVNGAFNSAMEGLRNCQDEGIKVGIRFTITRRNWDEIGAIFDLVEMEGIERVCFYHLVYSGRGSKLIDEDLNQDETRKAVDLIMERTKKLHLSGKGPEVLTVDNHADGPYLYMRVLREDPLRAQAVLDLLRMNGGNSSGVGIGCVSWDGSVHADQFWRIHSFGNVRKRPFSEIWEDPSIFLLSALKDRKRFLKGRCRICRWLDICNGNFRARAEALTGDPWAPDPACYLTDEEIGIGI